MREGEREGERETFIVLYQYINPRKRESERERESARETFINN